MLSDKQLKAKIRGIGQRQASLKQDIHEAAIECAGHAQQHGRATMAQDLFLAVKGQDRHALVGWFHHYTPVKLDKDGKATINKTKRKDFDGDGDALIAELREAMPWYEFVKELDQVAKDLDVAKSISALAKRINSAPEKGRGVNVNSTAVREALIELQIAMESAQKSDASQIETTDSALNRELRMVA